MAEKEGDSTAASPQLEDLISEVWSEIGSTGADVSELELLIDRLNDKLKTCRYNC
jgi:hypothetical protein